MNDIVFIMYSPSNPSHLVSCTLYNAGMILFSQTSNMILINATLLPVHFNITSKILCVCFMYIIYVFYDLIFSIIM